jgi:hypothetical protein
MNESSLPPSRANTYVQLGAQFSSGIAPHASASNYIVGQLHTERPKLTREQIAARCRSERLEAGLPVYEAPKVSAREAAPSHRQFLLQQATSLARGLRSVAEAVFDAVMPRLPGAAASELRKDGIGDYAEPIGRSARLPLGSMLGEFSDLVESLGLHASYSHQFARLDASEPARSASWIVTPSLDPDTLSLDDLLVLLESSQPGDQRRAEQLKRMVSFLLKQDMRVFTATPDVLNTLPCGTLADCVPVRSLCDGKVLLDTVLAAVPGKGNVVILPADAIESLASMINPAYGNATEDFVWVTSYPMRTLGPQYRLNCPAQPTTTGQVSAQPSPTGQVSGQPESCSAHTSASLAVGFSMGTVLGVLSAALVFVYWRCTKAATEAAAVTQRLPQQIRNNNMDDQKDDEMRGDMDYEMENMSKEKNDRNERNEKTAKQEDVEASPLEAISSSDDD